MQTIVNIEAKLLLYARNRAEQQGYTVDRILEDALRNFLSHPTYPLKVEDKKIFSSPNLDAVINSQDNPMHSDIVPFYWRF